MSDSADNPQLIKFHYIKTPGYAEIPVHGIFGGINPASGRISMAVFAERGAIPQEVFYEVGDEEQLQEVREMRVGKDGPVRIIQAVLHIDINVAVSMRKWLDGKIADFVAAHPELKNELEKLK